MEEIKTRAQAETTEKLTKEFEAAVTKLKEKAEKDKKEAEASIAKLQAEAVKKAEADVEFKA